MSASEQLGIDLILTSFDELVTKTTAFTRVAGSADRAVKKLNKSLASLPARSTPGVSSVPAVIPANASTPARRGGRAPVGIHQRHEHLSKLLASGNLSGAVLQDTRIAFERNHKRLKSLEEGNSPSSRIMNALMSTRLNLGHASPLVGRTLSAVGVGAAEAAPVLLVAGAAAAAAAAFYKLAEQSAALGNTFGRFTDLTGSSGAAAAQLQSLGSAGGVDTASIANSIQQHITGDPAGMAGGLRLGVHNLPGPYGDQDYGKQELTIVTSLRKITSTVERLRLARSVGAEGLLSLTRLSDKQFEKTKQDADVRSSILSPKFMQEAADFQASIGRVGDAVQNLMAALGQNAMQELTDFFNGLADTINNFAKWTQKNQWFQDLTTGLLGGEKTVSFGDNGLEGGHSDDLARALGDNTRATRDNTQIIGKPGFYGRSTRGQAIPGGFNGQSLDQSRDIGTLQLGVF